MQFFAIAQAQLHLYTAVLEIQGQGNEGHAVLHDAGMELKNFTLVHKQPSGAHRVFVENVAVLIGTYVHAPEKKLPILYSAEAVFHVDLACTDGLDLSAKKLDTGLKAVKNKIFMKSLAVFCNFFCAALLCHRIHLPSTKIKIQREVL